ncbi:MAG TPA: hypothetical protein VL053_17245 [Arachidicoccus sp.]|nr:hypothetical protein [Arachidicoccus sp.]
MKKKYYFVFILVILSICSCKAVKRGESTKLDGKELIKQLAFCKCLNYCFSNINNTDSVDNSIQWLKGMLLDRYGRYYSFKIEPTIDSLAKKEYRKIEKSRYPDQPVAEGSYGKASYSIDCLNFYKSDKLDSLTNEMEKEFKDIPKNN